MSRWVKSQWEKKVLIVLQTGSESACLMYFKGFYKEDTVILDNIIIILFEEWRFRAGLYILYFGFYSLNFEYFCSRDDETVWKPSDCFSCWSIYWQLPVHLPVFAPVRPFSPFYVAAHDIKQILCTNYKLLHNMLFYWTVLTVSAH